MFHLRFILRQIGRSRYQAGLFVACTALSIVSLVALRSLSAQVAERVKADARQLQGADIIIRSHAPFSPKLLRTVAQLRTRENLQHVRTWQFYTLARTVDESRSLLAGIKAVSDGYPLYGKVQLASGRPLAAALNGAVIVEASLLDRLQLKVGDHLRIGQHSLPIADVVTYEPDRPVTFFALGPRVLIPESMLPQLDLLKPGSRARYKILLGVPDRARIDALTRKLRAAAIAGQEQVETYRSARNPLQRPLDNLLLFLQLIGVFTLVLAGIGIQSTLTALLTETEKTTAILKTVGADRGYLYRHYLTLVLLLGGLGTVFGILAGWLVHQDLPSLFAGLLPVEVERASFGWAALEGLLMGSVVVALFTLIPLRSLAQVRPIGIFRRESRRGHGRWAQAGIYLAVIILFVAMVIRQSPSVKSGLIFSGSLLGLVAAAFLFAWLCLWAVSRWPLKGFIFRQAARGLFRPGNATLAIATTLTAALTLLFTLFLVESNLETTFVQRFPADAPNLFFIDIQPEQNQAVRKILPPSTRFYPIVRARLLFINQVPVDYQKERRRRGDNMARPFNLTWRDSLLDDERLQAGRTLFGENTGISVSILDTMAEIGDIQMGDRIGFSIQGVPLTATVTSIRERTKDSLRPFFYFVFDKKTLQKAPQTLFAAVRIPPASIPALQRGVSEAFPNISAVDVSVVAALVSRIVDKFARIVRSFTVFSLGAGVLIMISAIMATRLARTQQGVYYKVLGARPKTVAAIFICEQVLIALISGLLATGFSQLAAAIFCRQVLMLDYLPMIGPNLALVVVLMILMAAAGTVAAIPILRLKPAAFLRAQSGP